VHLDGNIYIQLMLSINGESSFSVKKFMKCKKT